MLFQYTVLLVCLHLKREFQRNVQSAICICCKCAIMQNCNTCSCSRLLPCHSIGDQSGLIDEQHHYEYYVIASISDRSPNLRVLTNRRRPILSDSKHYIHMFVCMPSRCLRCRWPVGWYVSQSDMRDLSVYLRLIIGALSARVRQRTPTTQMATAIVNASVRVFVCSK